MKIRDFVWPDDDSITELAEFWDSHDLTDFEHRLEEVTEPVFERDESVTIPLNRETAEAVRQIAKSRGFPSSQLIKSWIAEKVHSFDFDTTSQQ